MASQKSIPVVVLAVLLTTEALDCKWVSIVAPVMLCTPRPILANQVDWARVGPVVILAPWPILALHRIGASVAHTTVGRWPAGLRLLTSPASHRVDSRVIAHLANILYVPVSLTGLSQENLTITIKFCLLSPFPCFLVRLCMLLHLESLLHVVMVRLEWLILQRRNGLFLLLFSCGNSSWPLLLILWGE